MGDFKQQFEINITVLCDDIYDLALLLSDVKDELFSVIKPGCTDYEFAFSETIVDDLGEEVEVSRVKVNIKGSSIQKEVEIK